MTKNWNLCKQWLEQKILWQEQQIQFSSSSLHLSHLLSKPTGSKIGLKYSCFKRWGQFKIGFISDGVVSLLLFPVFMFSFSVACGKCWKKDLNLWLKISFLSLHPFSSFLIFSLKFEFCCIFDKQDFIRNDISFFVGNSFSSVHFLLFYL